MTIISEIPRQPNHTVESTKVNSYKKIIYGKKFTTFTRMPSQIKLGNIRLFTQKTALQPIPLTIFIWYTGATTTRSKLVTDLTSRFSESFFLF